jgi:mono/diheme cytochrome c family protein
MKKNTFFSLRTINIIATTAAAGLLLLAAVPEAKVSADNSTPDSKTVYVKYCAACHGNTGQGGMASGFKTIKKSDAKLADAIKNGAKGGMPAFGKSLTDNQITTLVTYLHTFSKK